MDETNLGKYYKCECGGVFHLLEEDEEGNDISDLDIFECDTCELQTEFPQDFAPKEERYDTNGKEIIKKIIEDEEE
jgi:hypothetical protein